MKRWGLYWCVAIIFLASTACSETSAISPNQTETVQNEPRTLAGQTALLDDREVDDGKATTETHADQTIPSFRGWDYLAHKLIADGVRIETVKALLLDPRFPEFTPVPFQLKPRESAQLYINFTQDRHVKVAQDFLTTHRSDFIDAEQRYGVSRFTVAAILLIETYCGKNFGNHLIAYRLARVASVGDPENLEYNLMDQRKSNPEVTFQEVTERAQYLEETFYPEFRALFDMQARFGISLFDLKGSIAGAFGYPQFLPQSYLRFAVDGDQDGQIDLFSPTDAIFSAAHFLSHYGWKDSSPLYEKKRALWAYNRSDAYADAVLKVAIRLRESSVKRSPVKSKAVASPKKRY